MRYKYTKPDICYELEYAVMQFEERLCEEDAIPDEMRESYVKDNFILENVNYEINDKNEVEIINWGEQPKSRQELWNNMVEVIREAFYDEENYYDSYFSLVERYQIFEKYKDGITNPLIGYRIHECLIHVITTNMEYKLFNLKTGEEFEGTTEEINKKLGDGVLDNLKNGRLFTKKGWCFYENKEEAQIQYDKKYRKNLTF